MPRTDDRNRRRAAGLLDPGEEIRALTQLGTAPEGGSIGELRGTTTTLRIGSVMAWYLDRAALDTAGHLPMLANGGWACLTDRRVAMIAAHDLKGGPGRITHHHPADAVRLNWFDKDWRRVPCRVFHFTWPDGRYTVLAMALRRFALFGELRHDEHDLLVSELGERATNLAPESLAAA